VRFRFAFFLVITAAGLACGAPASDEGETSSDELRALTGPEIVGTIAYGAPPVSVPYTKTPLYRALSFVGQAGDDVDIWVRGGTGQAYAWLLGSNFATKSYDHAPAGAHDAHMALTLTASGTHYIAFREASGQPATFSVSLAKGLGGGEDDAGAADTGTKDAAVDASPPKDAAADGAGPVTYAAFPLGPVSLQVTVPGIDCRRSVDTHSPRGVVVMSGSGSVTCTFTGTNPGTVNASCTAQIPSLGVGSFGYTYETQLTVGGGGPLSANGDIWMHQENKCCGDPFPKSRSDVNVGVVAGPGPGKVTVSASVSYENYTTTATTSTTRVGSVVAP